MLEFIVLGQIPGTQIYVPFGVTIISLAIVVFVAIVWSGRFFSVMRGYRKRLRQISDTSL